MAKKYMTAQNITHHGNKKQSQAKPWSQTTLTHCLEAAQDLQKGFSISLRAACTTRFRGGGGGGAYNVMVLSVGFPGFMASEACSINDFVGANGEADLGNLARSGFPMAVAVLATECSPCGGKDALAFTLAAAGTGNGDAGGSPEPDASDLAVPAWRL